MDIQNDTYKISRKTFLVRRKSTKAAKVFSHVTFTIYGIEERT